MIKKLNFYEAVLYLINYSSLTYVFIFLNLNGNHHDSLTISLFQTIASLITLGFSGDFRSLHFSNKIYSLFAIKFRSSVVAIALLGLIYYFYMAPESSLKYFVLWLSLKRIIDWTDEIVIISGKAFLIDNSFKFKYILSQVFFTILLPFIFLLTPAYMHYYFLIWIVLNITLLKKYYMFFYMKNIRNQKLMYRYSDQKNIFSQQLVSTLLLNSSNLFLRATIFTSFLPQKSSMVISSLALGGMVFSIANNSILPYLAEKMKKVSRIYFFFKKHFFLILLIPPVLIYLTWFCRGNLFMLNISYEIVLLGLLSSGILFFTSFLRYSIIQSGKYSTLREDFFSQASFILLILFIYINRAEYLIYSTIALSIICLLVFSLRYSVLAAQKWPTLIYLLIETVLLLLLAFLAISNLAT